MTNYFSFAALMKPLKALQNPQDILPKLAEQLQNMPYLNGYSIADKESNSEVLAWYTDADFNYRTQSGPLYFSFAFNPLPSEDFLEAFVVCLENMLYLDQHFKAMAQETEVHELQAYAALKSLRKTQSELIEEEKMASLAGLVTGMAHELNTPLGIGVTATSALQEDVKQLEHLFLEGTLSKQKMQDLLMHIKEAGSLLEKHLNVASRLIQNFKQISAQQVYESTQTFDIFNQSEAVFSTLKYQWKTPKLPLEIRVVGQSPCLFNGYPGVLTQILTELIENSFCHAWPNSEQHKEARITLDILATEEDEEEGMAALFELLDERLEHTEGDGKSWDELKKRELCLRYSDNGVGISDSLKKLLFEPFSTRDKSRFGGLGLHMVYNLVHHKLAGEINFITDPKGAVFEIKIPYEPIDTTIEPIHEVTR